jgi:uncharacterized membrane protein YqjE
MVPTGADNPGVAEKLRALAGDGVEYAEARLELLSLEARESGGRLARACVLVIAGAIAAHLGLMGVLAAVVVLLHTHAGMAWLTALLLIAGANVVAALLLGLAARSALRHPHFASTIGELRKDRAWITNPHPPTAPH